MEQMNYQKENLEQKNKNKDTTDSLLKELEKAKSPDAIKILEEYNNELENLEKEKNAEINNYLNEAKKWHKLSQAEIKLESEIKENADYSNHENVKKITQLAFIKKAKQLQEEKIA